MNLTIVLRKQVSTIEQAETITKIVRDKLADQPEIDVRASVGQEILEQEPPE